MKRDEVARSRHVELVNDVAMTRAHVQDLELSIRRLSRTLELAEPRAVAQLVNRLDGLARQLEDEVPARFGSMMSEHFSWRQPLPATSLAGSPSLTIVRSGNVITLELDDGSGGRPPWRKRLRIAAV